MLNHISKEPYKILFGEGLANLGCNDPLLNCTGSATDISINTKRYGVDLDIRIDTPYTENDRIIERITKAKIKVYFKKAMIDLFAFYYLDRTEQVMSTSKPIRKHDIAGTCFTGISNHKVSLELSVF